MAMTRKQIWRYTRALAVPVVLWCFVVFALKDPVVAWLQGDRRYDEAAIREWIKEARVFRDTLPEMAVSYLDRLHAYDELLYRAEPENAEARDRLHNDRALA